MSEDFYKVKRLPPYIFNIINEFKINARHSGEDIIDLGMGNPDIPTPNHIIEKAKEALDNPKNHRYGTVKGLPKLRLAMADWYKRHYNVSIDPEKEVISTLGVKEGLSHLVLSMLAPGDMVFVPTPTYPIHSYSVIIAGGQLRCIKLESDFFDRLKEAYKLTYPKPKLLIISFPHNPTTMTVDLDFFEKIVEFAKENNLYVIHDLAYADLTFDGFKAPSLLEIEGAKDIGVEFYSMSKSYSMPGWRIGFAIGNHKMIKGLTRIKSYLDYGIFQPLQIAAIIALNGDYSHVERIRDIYQKRRDTLVDGLNKIGFNIEKPKATMFVWAKIPEKFLKMGSLEFSKLLIKEAKTATSPGIGFGDHGEGFIRFSLVENEKRIKQAVKGIKKVLDSF